MSKKSKIIETEKFRNKCEKKLKYLTKKKYNKNDFETLYKVFDEVVNTIKSKDIDTETFNRIVSHPDRLTYHANRILNITDKEIKKNKQMLNELKTSIVYHDISKVIDFDKYNADRKKDHGLFSAIIIEVMMNYLQFDKDVIQRIYVNILYHTEKNKEIYGPELDIVGLLLMDVDIIDEQDVYGLLLSMQLSGNKNNIDAANKINHKDMVNQIDWFIENRRYIEKLNLEESKEYYNITYDNKFGDAKKYNIRRFTKN